MPIYDYLCTECGKTTEVLLTSFDQSPACAACGSVKLTKLLSPTSSLSGSARKSFPANGDTACCGSSPNNAGCSGPGSCCGKSAF